MSNKLVSESINHLTITEQRTAAQQYIINEVKITSKVHKQINTIFNMKCPWEEKWEMLCSYTQHMTLRIEVNEHSAAGILEELDMHRNELALFFKKDAEIIDGLQQIAVWAYDIKKVAVDNWRMIEHQ